MEQVLFLLLLVVCPLGMYFMMRGSGGHDMHNMTPGPEHMAERDARIAELEHEVRRPRDSVETCGPVGPPC